VGKRNQQQQQQSSKALNHHLLYDETKLEEKEKVPSYDCFMFRVCVCVTQEPVIVGTDLLLL